MPETESNFFLASRKVSGVSLRHLLISSSFGVNALLYAVWLGYSLGVYSLIIQVAWSLGFLFLNPFMKLPDCSQGSSMPNILGNRFGRSMRVYAASVTALGLIMLLGWELAICSRTVIAQTSAAMHWTPEQSTWYSHLFLISAIGIAISYTATSGLKANAKAAHFLNFLKIAFLGLVTALAVSSLAKMSPETFKNALLPSFSQIASKFGVVAVVTNLVFNLIWQTVDASAWQSVLAADPEARKAQSRLLSISGLHIFVWVGLFGSIIGMSLVGAAGVDPDNILLMAVTRYDGLNNALLIGLFVTLASCLVTFADGILLTITQAATDDLWGSRGSAQQTRLRRAIIMGIIALSAWFVVRMVERSSFGLFNFVYALIIPQLSLIGAVVALRVHRHQGIEQHILKICGLALLIGLGFVGFGFMREVKWAMEIGGSAAIIASLGPVIFFSFKPTHHD